MDIKDVRNVINMCEKSGVQSIAVEGYEWLIAKGVATEAEYNLYRINARYRKIYGLERN